MDANEQERRLEWSATGEQLTHHNASAQVVSEGPNDSRVVWIADLLPDEMAPTVAAMMDHGMAAMKKTLESQAA